MKYWFPLAWAAAFAGSSFALPQATDLVKQMGLGYNIGNTMEVPGDPTGWGNTFPTAEYVKSIKNAGFNTVRIPCAWDTHAQNGTINSGWLDSVKTVVDMVIDNGMFAILNIHWDNGWLEDHVWDGSGYDRDGNAATNNAATIAAKQKSYWSQIATKFKDYDEKLIFASANEPGVNDPWNGGTDNGQWGFDETRMKVLKQYHEACLQAVRETGGNNATRAVIVQMPRTEINKYTLLQNNYPKDPAGNGYTMAEAHFYPYQYSLMTQDESWGPCFYYFDGMESSTDTKHNMGSSESTLGTKLYIDKQFDLLKNAFVNNGIPVVIGEMGAIKRLEEISGDNLKLHLQGRAAWYGYVAKAAKARGIVPCVWDTGDEGNGNMTILHRQSKFAGNVGDIVDYEVLNAMRIAYGLDTLAGNSIDKFVEASLDTNDKKLVITYTSQQSDSNEVGTMRIDLNGVNWSDYEAISFQAKVNVASAGPCSGASCNAYAWTSLSLFAMSGADWKWDDFNFPESDILSTWQTYTVSLDANGLNISDKSKVNAIGLNLYGTQVSGTIEIDNIVLHKANDSIVVLQDFNKKMPSLEGIASGELLPQTSAIQRPAASIALDRRMHVQVQAGILSASFHANRASQGTLKLINSIGQVIASQNFVSSVGANSISIETNYHGTGFLVLDLNSNRTTLPILLK
ncbi:glycoside hydrolase family 5 protein [uncultured Fibrobacter sp.]|uniref:glycoside hydrolase family 5 protein n=1 Tax=uncultured Fibrobacter sp. TaxID=261512 RepID=UPI0028041B0D|nr:glycoside hydrolase family 5 protein [uncultured Fibrobacter sp.]